MSSYGGLQRIADRGGLYAALQQDALVTASEALGEHRWDVDMASREFTLANAGDPSRRLVARAHLVASIAPGPRSILWGWAHPQGEGDGVMTRLAALAGPEAPELASGELAFPEDTGDDVDSWVNMTSHLIGAAAVEATGIAPYYSAPVGGGTRVVFLLEGLPLPEPSFTEAMAAVPRLLAAGVARDHRTAVWGLARRCGWPLRWVDDRFDAAEVTDGASVVSFEFDEFGRVTAMHGSLRGRRG